MTYKLLLTTSGTGSRLQTLTRDTNKALVPLNGKPTVDYILRQYAPTIPVVVTLGYLRQQVREFLLKFYPERSFEFVEVDPYEGPGSSLGYSLLQARPALDGPFVFHACDTVVLEPIPEPTVNWAAGYQAPATLDVSPYRTHSAQGTQLLGLNEKGVNGSATVHIGITGIADHAAFWKTLDSLHRENMHDSALSDVHVIDRMIQEGFPFVSAPFSTWLDTGNLEALRHTEAVLAQNAHEPTS